MNQFLKTTPWYERVLFALFMTLRGAKLFFIPDQYFSTLLTPRGKQVYTALKTVCNYFTVDHHGVDLKKTFVTDILAKASDDVSLEPAFLQRIRDQLSEVELEHKTLVKLILAYGVIKEYITLDEIGVNQSLTEYAGYKRAVNFKQQIEFTVRTIAK